MADTLSGLIIGTELAVFFVTLIYVILIDTTSGSKIPRSINIFAGALILAAGLKFFTSLLEIESALVTEVFTGALSLIAGLGLIAFLVNVNKNAESYR